MLKPILNNVTLCDNTTVLNITELGFLGTLVSFMKGQKVEYVLAKKEVIISAGAYDSPKLLQLSGIGKKEDLESVGISCKYDNEHVGYNLRESFTSALFFSPTVPSNDTPTGSILTRNYRTSNHTGPTDNMELSFFSTVEDGAPMVMCETLQFMESSSGYTKLQSNSPFDIPFITLNGWSDDNDKLSYIKGFRNVREIMSKASSKYIEVSPGLDKVPKDATDDQIFAHLKDHTRNLRFMVWIT